MPFWRDIRCSHKVCLNAGLVAYMMEDIEGEDMDESGARAERITTQMENYVEKQLNLSLPIEAFGHLFLKFYEAPLKNVEHS